MEFSKSNGRQLNKEDREFHKEDFERYKVSNFLFNILLNSYLTFYIIDFKSKIKVSRCPT